MQSLFFGTLGYKGNNGSLLKHLSPPKDGRGRHGKQTKKIDHDQVKSHILSFAPSISHYRRQHAPNKLYLPSDITIIDMHKSFIERYGTNSCSYDFYRYTVSKVLNISFTKLGNEECEKCAAFNYHDKSHKQATSEPSEQCSSCLDYYQHVEKAKEAREEYKKIENDFSVEYHKLNQLHVTVDLQKVVMIPRLDMFKEVIFTPRLIAFNESFVPIGKFRKETPPFAAIWHEAVSKRNKEDIASTFHTFLRGSYARDVKKIVFWTDNCSSQNKNWCLFSFLIYIINSDEIAADTISFKYFEPGHTFMAADSFHHLVEKELRRRERVFDFQDFHEVVQNCSKTVKPIVKSMEFKDFKKWPTLSSRYQNLKLNKNKVLLKDVKEVTVKRGSKNLFYKLSLNGAEETLFFLPKKFSKPDVQLAAPPSAEADVGISIERKEKILRNLLKLMPAHKKGFWIDLATSESPVAINVDDSD